MRAVNMDDCLAFIPARIGSRRLKEKNLRKINGMPLVTLAVNVAKEAGIKAIHVSTDDARIKSAAEKAGAKVRKRPKYLSGDDVSLYDVLRDHMRNCNPFETIIILQPTSPLRTAKHITEAMELFNEKDADCVLSVTTTHPAQWFMTKNSLGGYVFQLFDNNESRQLQDVGGIFIPNGCIYIWKRKALLEMHMRLPRNTHGYEMHRLDSVDIDTDIDLEIARTIAKTRKLK